MAQAIDSFMFNVYMESMQSFIQFRINGDIYKTDINTHRATKMDIRMPFEWPEMKIKQIRSCECEICIKINDWIIMLLDVKMKAICFLSLLDMKWYESET